MDKLDREWFRKKQKLQKVCIRKGHYCYGEPMNGKGENIGKCPYRKKGGCFGMEETKK